MFPINPQQARNLADQLLDRGYTQATRQSINAILRESTTGLIAQRLDELDAEAARLAALGQRLTADNPIARALLADLDTAMRRNGARLDAAAADVQLSGVNAAGPLTRQLSLGGLGDDALRSIGVRWNVPDPEQINAVVRYASSDAWRAAIDRYQAGVSERVLQFLVEGSIAGRGAIGPEGMANDLRMIVEGMPASAANNMLRTLQLTSWRDATVVHQAANRDILEDYAIRIGVLDGRICLSCLALHGTRIPLGERVDDHHMGRCTSIAPVRGRPVNVQTGEEWFGQLDETRQRQQMGEAAFAAWRAGEVQLSDFVQPYSDPIFGEMLREASLVEMLGDGASRFYAR